MTSSANCAEALIKSAKRDRPTWRNCKQPPSIMSVEKHQKKQEKSLKQPEASMTSSPTNKLSNATSSAAIEKIRRRHQRENRYILNGVDRDEYKRPLVAISRASGKQVKDLQKKVQDSKDPERYSEFLTRYKIPSSRCKPSTRYFPLSVDGSLGDIHRKNPFLTPGSVLSNRSKT